MKSIIYLFLFSLLLFSCKTPEKVASQSKVNKETNVNNDITMTDDERMTELTERIFKRLMNEVLNMDIKNRKYDTDKPADPVTGKPPVSEETNINIKLETNVQEADSTHQEKENISSSGTRDNSEMNEKIKTQDKEKVTPMLKGWQIGLMLFGLLALCGIAVYVFIKIKE